MAKIRRVRPDSGGWAEAVAIPVFKVLSFEHNGVPRMLSSLEEIERAIERGEIIADTPVTLYFDSKDRRFAPAAEHAQLARFFVMDAPEPQPDPEPQPSNAIATPAASPAPDVEETAQATPPNDGARDEPRDSPPDAGAADDPGQPEVVEEPASDAPPILPPSAEKKPNVAWGCVSLLGILGAAVALGRCVAGQPAGAPVDNTMIATTATPGASVEVPREVQRYYVVRKAPIRSIASADGGKLGELVRGDALRGYAVPGRRDPSTAWIRIIESGATRGYVSSVNVTGSPPPALDTSTAGAFYATRETNMFDAPDGALRRRIPLGTPLEVVGSVAGQAEVADKGGGVGYVHWDDINGNPYLTTRYLLKIRNNCADTKRFLLVWHQDGAWYLNSDQIYTINSNQENSLTYSRGGPGTQLVIDRLEIYYFPITREPSTYKEVRPIAKNAAVIDGRTVKMLTAIPTLSDRNVATVTFDGPAC